MKSSFETTHSSICARPLLSDCELRSLLTDARRTEARNLDNIERAARAGKPRKARKLLKFYFESFHCKLIALHKANRRRARAPRRPSKGLATRVQRLPEASLVQEAQSLTLRHPCHEPVHVFTKWKRSGGFRFIYDFGPRNRARQLMVAKGLKALHGHTLTNQFAVNGGRDACVQALLDRIAACEAEFVAEVDIRNFFGSINPDRLRKEIGLSNDLIDHVVGCGSYRICNAGYCLNASLQCRNGIPQGSLCSPIVAAVVVASVLRSNAFKRVINYADNFCLVGGDAESVRVQKTTLISALTSSRFGTFGMHSKVGTASAGISFLGYDIKGDADQIEIEPTEEALMNIEKRLIDRAKEVRRRGFRRLSVYAILEAQLEHWLPGYALSSIHRTTYMLRRFIQYLCLKPIKGYCVEQIRNGFIRWSSRLDRALAEREPLGWRQPILHEPYLPFE